MAEALVALLPDRGVVSVTGVDAAAFLDNLVTNDLDGMDAGAARFAALLNPQGKILFEFFIVRTAAGFLLETQLDRAADLAKRLQMYKLRSKVEIANAPGEIVVAASQGDVRVRPPEAIAFQDPREPRLGDRLLIPAPRIGGVLDMMGAQRLTPAQYDAQRIALGVAEGGRDYVLGDTFPHEANYDLLHGVSFSKGCFVGQEVVARMQNKTVVRKRVVRVAGAGLVSGGEVKLGEAAIGTIGTTTGTDALAMVRLDRVAEALDKGAAVTAAGAPVAVDAEALARYREAVAKRPVIDL